MTREEAKTVFLNRGYVEVEGGTIYDANKWRESCRVISEWLEQEPSGDLISRQAVLEQTYNWSKDEFLRVTNPFYYLRKRINSLPSVNPQEPKTGHLFVDERPESDREIICSNCEQPIFKYHKMDFDYRPKYCPNCGCRMIEPQESEE